jgi:hypothetical protein
VPYRRWLERYCPASPDACDLRTHPAATRDTITTAPLEGFGIRDYRLVECGSGLSVCAGDVLPAAPIAAMCKHLDDSPDHTCAFASYPDDSHARCQSHADECRTWFEALR